MADINLEFNVVDNFSKRLDDFDRRLKKLEGDSGKMEKATKDVGEAAQGAGGMFKGFGAAMFIANQAMQAFLKIAESVKGALDDISQKERMVATFGEDAGEAMIEYADNAARRFGVSRAAVMQSAMDWRRVGAGGEDITAMSEVASRMARINGRQYEEMADSMTDAIKSRDIGGLAEMLGGSEEARRQLERAGVGRKLRSGDVAGAMEGFKGVADGMGMTEARAEKMANNVSDKITRITTRIKDKFTDMFGGIVRRAEPYIDKVLEWVNSDDFEIFFDNIGRDISFVIDLIGDIGNAFGTVLDDFSSVGDDLIGESTTVTEKLVAIFVGGFTTIGAAVYDVFAGIWNAISTVIQNVVSTYRILSDYFGEDPLAKKRRDEYIRQGKELDTAIMWKEREATIQEGIVNGLQGQERIEAMENLIARREEILEMGKKRRDLGKKAMEAHSQHTDWLNAEELNHKIEFIDPTERTAQNIKATMDWINGHSVDRRQKKDGETKKAIKGIRHDLHAIRGDVARQKELDLRWLKEQSEQRFINNVNLRQLTPTINVQVSGTGASPEQIGKAIKRVLDEQAAAGTYGAYGEAV